MKHVWWAVVVCLWFGCGDDDGPIPDAGGDSAVDGAVECATACDDNVYCNGVELCDPTDARADDNGCVRLPLDCDDGIACTNDACSEALSRCVHDAPDTDEDGHRSAACIGALGEALGDDCDDNDATRYPGNAEVCDTDGKDEDCDARTFGAIDRDGDGSVDAACFNLDDNGTRIGGLDCDDEDLSVHGRQVELCDGIDNDCDLVVDEYPRVVPWYLDSDGDNFGAGSDVVLSCSAISGRSILGTDCDDTSASVHPAAIESCDGVDNNCDQAIDEGLVDCETTGEPKPPIVNPCLNGLDDCNEYAQCTDTAEGFTCTCNEGFRGTGHGLGGCSDVNECAPGAELACGVGATTCLNGLGSYACFCAAGFSGTGQTACVDNDECLIDNGGCDSLRTCTNTLGSRTCDACDVGHTAVGATGCAPILLNLSASVGALSPALSPAVTEHTLRVGVADTSVTLTPITAFGVTVTINGQLVVAGTPWQSPTLSNENTLIGIVLSEPQRPSRYYALTIERPLLATFVKASNPEAEDAFGGWVSLSDDGNTLAVAALAEDSSATGVNGDQNNNAAGQSGAVYVFRRTSVGWAQEAYIKASNTDPNDNFGRAVTLSGDGNTLAVNGYFESGSAGGINGDQTLNNSGQSGAVYVYTRNAGVWTQQAYIKSDTPAGSHLFGAAIALSNNGNVLVAGTPQDDSNATGVHPSFTQVGGGGNETGAAYVFERSGTTWQQTAYLKASNTGSLDYFGNKLSISGDGGTIVVSAQSEASNATGINGNQANNTLAGAGAVYVFVRNGALWTQQAYVKASNTGTNNRFGSGLSLSNDGNVLAVGALEENSNSTGVGAAQPNAGATAAGAVYLFARNANTWSQITFIKASNTNAGDNFGSLVALSDDGTRLAVAAHSEDSAAAGVDGNQADNSSADAGAVYLFSSASGSWTQTAYVKSRNPDSGDRFGNIALSGDGLTLAVGSSTEDSSASGIDGAITDDLSNSGAVYIY